MNPIGLGDLLRVLQQLPPGQHAGAAAALGFELPQKKTAAPETPAPPPAAGSSHHATPEPGPAHEVADTAIPDTEPDPDPVNEVDILLEPEPAPRQVFWRVAADLDNPDAQTEAPAWLTQAEVPRLEDFESDPASAPPAVAPLVSAPRLAPFLRRHLARQHPTTDPDVPRLLRHLTRHEPIRRWPLRRRSGWPARVCVVFDTRRHLWPLDEDLRRVLQHLGHQLGRRVEVLEADAHPPAVPPDGRTAVVVLGDAGLGLGDADVTQRWAAWGRLLDRTGLRALLLAPVPHRLMRAEVAGHFDVALLHDDRPLPLRLLHRHGWPSIQPADSPPSGSPPPDPPHDITALRAALYGHPCVSPDLLRDVRRALVRQGATLDVGSELALWHDPLLRAGACACALLPAKRDQIRPDWEALPPAQQTAAIETIWAHLLADSPLVRAEYARHIAPLLPAGHPLAAELQQGIAQADTLARRTAVAIDRGHADLSDEMSAYMARFGLRNNHALIRRSRALRDAWMLAHREALQQQRMALPEGIDPAEYAWMLGQPGAAGLALVLHQPPGHPGRFQLELADRAIGEAVAVGLPKVSHWQVAHGSQPLQALARHEPTLLWSGLPYRVEAGSRRLQLEPFTRPTWAESIDFDAGHWGARLPDGRTLVWMPQQHIRVKDGLGEPSFLLPHGAWWASSVPRQRWPREPGFLMHRPRWAARHGTDSCGYWAEFDIPTRTGRPITQRMRFIPPGEFLMGSPESEPERFGNERQHRVILTSGFWLAETTCTQELWEAVMGENPSEFKNDAQNPVECVSWEDVVEKFLPKLNDLVPGLGLELPTEAQWEYACRAETQMPFWFGEQVTTEQVNYDGNVLYAGGKKGEYREKTVGVKALPANGWGLYQMHGNVWEWCADWLGAYPEGEVVDPRNSAEPQDQENRQRVLRGGSWRFSGRYCRSAYRNAFRPDDRHDLIGFRLARWLADQPAGKGQPPVKRSSPRSPEPPPPPPSGLIGRLGKLLGRKRK